MNVLIALNRADAGLITIFVQYTIPFLYSAKGDRRLASKLTITDYLARSLVKLWLLDRSKVVRSHLSEVLCDLRALIM